MSTFAQLFCKQTMLLLLCKKLQIIILFNFPLLIYLGLPTVQEWPGQCRNRRLASRVPGRVTFVPEVTDSSLS